MCVVDDWDRLAKTICTLLKFGCALRSKFMGFLTGQKDGECNEYSRHGIVVLRLKCLTSHLLEFSKASSVQCLS